MATRPGRLLELREVIAAPKSTTTADRLAANIRRACAAMGVDMTEAEAWEAFRRAIGAGLLG